MQVPDIKSKLRKTTSRSLGGGGGGFPVSRQTSVTSVSHVTKQSKVLLRYCDCYSHCYIAVLQLDQRRPAARLGPGGANLTNLTLLEKDLRKNSYCIRNELHTKLHTQLHTERYSVRYAVEIGKLILF